MRHLNVLLAAGLSVAIASACSIPGDETPTYSQWLFATPWNSGLSDAEPRFQVQAIDDHTFAVRQSLHTTPEAPFLYLLIGRERALLIDTGDGSAGLRAEIDGLLQTWQGASGSAELQLIVMHSHGHTDHVGGDADFVGRAHTTVVGHSPTEVADFFGIQNWPNESVSFDLGGRVVEVLPAPGHQAAHVAVFDYATRILFTGDAAYPGILRFQCGNAAQYLASVERIREFAAKNNARWLLGGHIEMRAAAGQFYRSPDLRRRDEHRLELDPSVLSEITAALRRMEDHPRVESHDDFVLFPYPDDPEGRQPPDWCDSTDR